MDTKYTLLRRRTEAAKGTAVSLSRLMLCLTASFILLCLSYISGRASAYKDLHSEVPLTSHPKLFEYNHTFGDRPSAQSNLAWKTLFPEQGGFFKHPRLAPNRSALSVFHLLHCVDGIRHGYWRVLDAAMAGEMLNTTEIPFMASPRHISHCIDLLRNSLMCYPDTTVEVKDDKVRGVTGFGTAHQCRDWDALVAWTSKWEIYGQGGKPSEDSEHGLHDHMHSRG